MIVDDDVEMRTLLAEYFRRLGFDVAEKESGAAALQTVTTNTFDCFILDVSMPEMSGTEMVRRLRLARPGLRVLYLTDNANALSDGHVARGEREAYLPKPFTLNGLCDAVASLLHSPARPTRAVT